MNYSLIDNPTAGILLDLRFSEKASTLYQSNIKGIIDCDGTFSLAAPINGYGHLAYIRSGYRSNEAIQSSVIWHTSQVANKWQKLH